MTSWWKEQKLCLFALLSITATLVASQCPGAYVSGALPDGSACYFHHPANLPFSSQQSVCNSYSGGNLVSIHSQDEMTIIDNILQGSGLSSVWIGYHLLAGQYLDGTPVDYGPVVQGTPTGSSNDCVSYVSPSTWKTNSCFSGKHAVCKLVLACRDPGSPTGTTRTLQGTQFGHTVTYTCNTHHTLTTGNLFRTCQPSGVWSGQSPICMGPAVTAGATTMTTAATAKTTGATTETTGATTETTGATTETTGATTETTGATTETTGATTETTGATTETSGATTETTGAITKTTGATTKTAGATTKTTGTTAKITGATTKTTGATTKTTGATTKTTGATTKTTGITTKTTGTTTNPPTAPTAQPSVSNPAVTAPPTPTVASGCDVAVAARQRSTSNRAGAKYAIDGLPGTCSATGDDLETWFKVELQCRASVSKVTLEGSGIDAIQVIVGDHSDEIGYRGGADFPGNRLCAKDHNPPVGGRKVVTCDNPVRGTYVHITSVAEDSHILSICSLKIN